MAAKSTPKTLPTGAGVVAFLAEVPDPVRRADGQALCELMQSATGLPPVMWGASIVGFGSYHYKYDSGREGDSVLVGFSPRKAELVIYVVPGFAGYTELLARLGRHRIGKVCLYIKRLADVDLAVLRQIIVHSVAATAARHGPP
jgi:hypothetical protein